MNRPCSLGRVILCVLTLAGCRSATTRDAAPEPPHRLDAVEGLRGDTGVVRTDFRSELEPSEQIDAHLDLARAHEVQGQFEAAVVEYQKALDTVAGRRFRARPPAAKRALAHRRMAAALDRLGRFAQAATHYREALRLRPDDPKVWNDHGYSQYLQGRWEEAERSLRTAATLAPDDPKIQTNLGLALAASGKTDAALESLSRAGGPAIGHANLAFILAASGKAEDARRHYEDALRLQPNLEPARAALAQLDRAPNGDSALVAGTTTRAPDRAVQRVAASPGH
jgi:Flp pilus assembly protein TadD